MSDADPVNPLKRGTRVFVFDGAAPRGRGTVRADLGSELLLEMEPGCRRCGNRLAIAPRRFVSEEP